MDYCNELCSRRNDPATACKLCQSLEERDWFLRRCGGYLFSKRLRNLVRKDSKESPALNGIADMGGTIQSQPNNHNDSSVSDDLHGSRPDLNLIRDQIDQMQIEIAERKKPWYQQATTIISILAFLVSLGGTGHTVYRGNSDDLRVKKEEFRSLIVRMLDWHEKFEETKYLKEIEHRKSDISLPSSFQLLIDLQAAENLVLKIPKKDITSAEYIILAKSSFFRERYKQAEDYYEKAVLATGKVNIDKIEAITMLASAYFKTTPIQNCKLGRIYYQQALDLFTGASFPSLNMQMSRVYREWGISELTNGFTSQGNEFIHKARMYVSKSVAEPKAMLQAVDRIDREAHFARTAWEERIKNPELEKKCEGNRI